MDRPHRDDIRDGTEQGSACVFVLRDPRNGAVFFVGSGPAGGTRIDIGAHRPNPIDDAPLLARIAEIRADRQHVERIVIDDTVANDHEARNVARAIAIAYHTVGIDVMTQQLGPDASADSAVTHRYRGSAEFATLKEDSSETGSLQSAVGSDKPGFLDSQRRARLEDLIIDQSERISQLTSTLARIHALADLAEWANEDTNSSVEGSPILLSDLRHALMGLD
jgi:hypothetical protein